MSEEQKELIELYKRLRSISKEIFDIKQKLSSNSVFKKRIKIGMKKLFI